MFINLRTSSDATNYDSGSSDYSWYTTVASTEYIDNADTLMSPTGHQDTGGTSFRVGSDTDEHGVCGQIWIFQPHATSQTIVGWDLAYHGATATKMGHANGGGVRRSAADVDGFRILFSSGNIESGTVTAYGLANA